MNIKKILLSSLLMLGFLSASAEEGDKVVYDFQPHWYVQIQPLGGQYTLGEPKFGDLVSYNAQLGLGYQFNPVVGARLAVNAWQSKAGMKYVDANWKWKYVAPSVDVTANLSNLFCGYNPTRLFNFSVFLGLGANIAWDNNLDQATANLRTAYPNTFENLAYAWDGTATRLFGQGGVQADFRISDAVSVGLEVNANTLNDKYNSKRAGNADWYFNALAGVKINLGKTYQQRIIPAPKPIIQYVDRVVERVVEKPAPVPAPEPVVEALRRDIFFTINSTRISQDQLVKVQDIAAYLLKYPNARVTVTGYADKGTGNARINASLARRRAAVVADMLVKQYGISADRITSDSKGDTVQPFEDNDKNRVTIAIAE